MKHPTASGSREKPATPTQKPGYCKDEEAKPRPGVCFHCWYYQKLLCAVAQTLFQLPCFRPKAGLPSGAESSISRTADTTYPAIAGRVSQAVVALAVRGPGYIQSATVR